MNSKDKPFIPVAEPVFIGNEKKYVADCMETTWISSKGKYIKEFEESFANFCGAEFAISCSNGTVALHLALLALGIGPEDEVIVPTFTYVATANSVMYTGATPVFVDSEPICWNLDPERIEDAITERTKAIIAVHIYGHPVNIALLREIADRNNLYIIEDAAEAFAATYKGVRTGVLGDIGTFSFFGNKILTTGEGGMITTNNAELAKKMIQLKGQGLDPIKRYWFPIIGYNYRMTNIQAAIGLAQLESSNWHVEQRRRVFLTYQKYLGKFQDLIFQPELQGYTNSYWMTSCILGEDLPDRDLVQDKLLEKGIETRPFFYPMHVLPMYQELARGKDYPVADHISQRGMNLPSSARLSEDEIRYISESLISILDLKQ